MLQRKRSRAECMVAFWMVKHRGGTRQSMLQRKRSRADSNQALLQHAFTFWSKSASPSENALVLWSANSRKLT